jgi:two-component system phosphate regulon sensor histidine kinase PhoR
LKLALRKLYLIILAIIVLPSLIFVVYEVSTLRQSEKVIEDIYNNQLEAILYSINQYAEDVVSDWANQLERALIMNDANEAQLKAMMNEMPSVLGIIQYDSATTEVARVIADTSSMILAAEAIEILSDNKQGIDRLLRYSKQGYRKIESFTMSDGLLMLVFIARTGKQQQINAIMLNPRGFITAMLDPKIQQIAGERFYIAALYMDEDSVIYSSNKQYLPTSMEQTRAFWILDNYLLGIEMKDKTIADLAQERSTLDLMMIAIVEILLLIGAWVIFRNVKKQMELAQIKSEFVSNVSHEIRTPLALISMYIESLERGTVTDPDKIKEYCSITLQETQRLTSIVNKILNFSRIESGRRQFVFQEVDVNEVVREVVDTFKLKLEHKAFSWSLHPADSKLLIKADREAITDVIVNLLDNSIKYSAEIKSIKISTGVEKGSIFVEVQDKGLGISKTEQKHIFEKFYRVTQQDLAHKAKGSGVGLAIVKHIMDAHQGDILCEVNRERAAPLCCGSRNIMT